MFYCSEAVGFWGCSRRNLYSRTRLEYARQHSSATLSKQEWLLQRQLIPIVYVNCFPCFRSVGQADAIERVPPRSTPFAPGCLSSRRGSEFATGRRSAPIRCFPAVRDAVSTTPSEPSRQQDNWGMLLILSEKDVFSSRPRSAKHGGGMPLVHLFFSFRQQQSGYHWRSSGDVGILCTFGTTFT